ncbi:hypothetical protein AB0N05_24570 [Nocardia sp. NPDC051030]|uniref:hypothetical protein n=1 Tax=Nocardia sp. NPDC051030 TaxID=3155162 RepID=UPI00341CCDEC
MDATSWLGPRDYRLFKGDQLAVIDTTNGNKISYEGKIGDHGTYANIPANFKRSIDATTWRGVPGDYRLFRGDRVISIDTSQGNKVIYDGLIADHGTYANIPESFKRGIDATSWLSATDYRLFKGDWLVVIDTTHGNRITYDGLIADHGTYANLPAAFARCIDATTWRDVGTDYRLFKRDRLVVIDTVNGNAVKFDDKIANHGTYQNLSSYWTS